MNYIQRDDFLLRADSGLQMDRLCAPFKSSLWSPGGISGAWVPSTGHTGRIIFFLHQENRFLPIFFMCQLSSTRNKIPARYLGKEINETSKLFFSFLFFFAVASFHTSKNSLGKNAL